MDHKRVLFSIKAFIIVLLSPFGFMGNSMVFAERSLHVVDLHAVPDSAPGRIALVIGNSKYALKPLRNPENDAYDMASTLEELGFHTILALNANQKKMLQSINEFSQQLGKEDVGLFFFAGHGMQLSGTNYLIPVGAKIKSGTHVQQSAVSVDLILEAMEKAGNPLNIIILDACRDNPFFRSYFPVSSGLAEMNAPSGSLICYATAPGSVALDGSGRNGVFTHCLLRHMKTTGMELNRMMKKVRMDVITATSGTQTPWEASSLTGDFYFIRSKSGPGAEFVPYHGNPIDSSLENRQGLEYLQKAMSARSMNPHQAIGHLKKAIGMNPNDAEAHHLMGSIYFKDLKQYHKSVLPFRKAVDLFPDKTLFLNDLGRAYLQIGEKPKAIRFLKQSLEREFDRAETHYLLGVAYKRLGSRSLAVKFLNRAVVLDDTYRAKVSKHIKE
jgi:tetratricopeptide (TPR) repeat protein